MFNDLLDLGVLGTFTYFVYKATDIALFLLRIVRGK